MVVFCRRSIPVRQFCQTIAWQQRGEFNLKFWNSFRLQAESKSGTLPTGALETNLPSMDLHESPTDVES